MLLERYCLYGSELQDRIDDRQTSTQYGIVRFVYLFNGTAGGGQGQVKPVHFSLDGRPLSCYFFGSVATGSGHFVHKSKPRLVQRKRGPISFAPIGPSFVATFRLPDAQSECSSILLYWAPAPLYL